MRLIAVLLSVSALYGQEFIFEKAPFASCHASTLVELRTGGFMASWFGGTAEGENDVAIWGSTKSGETWSAPVELVREPGTPTWNPVLFYTADHRLWLYYKFGPSPDRWSAGRRFSTDDGQTWSVPEHLPAGLYGPIRAKPLVLKDGTIVSGTSVESYHSWAAWVERSSDGGKSWSKFGPIVPPGSPTGERPDGIIQPSVVQLGGNRLRLYARATPRIGHICVADSMDAGVTWTQARPLSIPNPNSGIDATALRDGRIVLVYNETPKGRTPLNLAVSRDGENFRMFKVLESEPGEYSYPALIQAANGDLHITYTWKRQRIKHVRIPLGSVPE